MEKLLSVGKIINFHGINGEVKVGYTAEKKEQLLKIKEFWIEKLGKLIKLNLSSIRFHKQYAIIKFEEINSVNEASNYKGAYIKVPKRLTDEFLQENEFYIDDLVGMQAYDDKGNYLGKIDYIVNIKEEDLLAIKDDEDNEHLVPFVKDIVPEVDINTRKVIINTLEGLFEKAE